MESEFQDDLLQSYSEAELARFITASATVGQYSFGRVYLLSENLVAKSYRPDRFEDAVAAMETARQLGIRVPCIRRTIEREGDKFCIMDRIPGATLEVMWTKLGWIRTVLLAFQLRQFTKILRSVTSPTAGSLASGECRSFYLEDHYGVPVRASPRDLACFLKFWQDFPGMRKAIQAEAPTIVDTKRDAALIPRTLVFTHHDLAPRNIQLHSGQLWLLDWDYAGFYPMSFEYAAMQNFIPPLDWSRATQLRWRLYSWIAVGWYERQARSLEVIRSRFTRFSAGRRFQLLKYGGPCRRAPSLEANK